MKFTPAPEMVSAGQAVIMAMAYLQTIEPVVLAYKRRLLADGKWTIRPEFAERLGSEVITNPSQAYLMSDADFAQYDALCMKARDEAKLVVSKPEFCPLLEAESLLADTQNALIETMSSITTIKANEILVLGMSKRTEFIDLTLKLLAPFIRNQFAYKEQKNDE